MEVTHASTTITKDDRIAPLGELPSRLERRRQANDTERPIGIALAHSFELLGAVPVAPDVTPCTLAKRCYANLIVAEWALTRPIVKRPILLDLTILERSKLLYGSVADWLFVPHTAADNCGRGIRLRLGSSLSQLIVGRKSGSPQGQPRRRPTRGSFRLD